MQIYLLLNNICNLNCNFCIRGDQTNSNILDIESLKYVLLKNDFHNYHLLLTGGEPSLYPNLAEVITLCQSHFKSVSINTNGVNSLWIDMCNNNDFHVQISLDGTAEYHNMLRGNGTIDVYSAIQGTIQKLNYKNISYNISTTVGIENYNNIKLLCKQIENFPKMKYWKISPQLPFGCAKNNDFLDIDEWNDLVDYLLDNANVLLSINKLFDFDLLNQYLQTHVKKAPFKKTNCGNIKYKVYIYPDLTVYPCTCLTDFPLGNLQKSTLIEILNNEKSALFKNYQVKQDSICYNCKCLPICNGGCIGMSYHFFGELGVGDYRCPLMKKQ